MYFFISSKKKQVNEALKRKSKLNLLKNYQNEKSLAIKKKSDYVIENDFKSGKLIRKK